MNSRFSILNIILLLLPDKLTLVFDDDKLVPGDVGGTPAFGAGDEAVVDIIRLWCVPCVAVCVVCKKC